MRNFESSSPQVLSVVLVFFVSAAAADPISLSADLTIDHDDNVGLAERGVDAREDFVTAVTLGASKRFLVGTNSGMKLGASVRGKLFRERSDLDNVGAELSARYRYQPHTGFGKPWFGVDAAIRIERYSDSDIREGRVLTGRALVGVQLASGLSIEGGLTYQNRKPRNGRVFKSVSRGLFLDADLVLGPRTTVYTGYRVRRGEVVSTAGAFGKIIAAFSAVAPDPAVDPTLFAWRLDALTHQGRLGVNYAINRNHALDLSVRFSRYGGDRDNDWTRLEAGAAYLYRF